VTLTCVKFGVESLCSLIFLSPFCFHGGVLSISITHVRLLIFTEILGSPCGESEDDGFADVEVDRCFRSVINLIMEAVRTSESRSTSARLHGAISQKVSISIWTFTVSPYDFMALCLGTRYKTSV
jgi:hypothetical protein